MSNKALNHVYKTRTSGTARLLLMILAHHADDDGRGSMMIISAIQYAQAPRRTIKRALKTLERVGVLWWVDTLDFIDYEILGVGDE